MDAIKKLSVMVTSSEDNSGIRLLSISLNEIYHAVFKVCKAKGIDVNVMFINEHYKDCSFQVEMYPHSVDGSPELLACDYSITFKRVDKETSVTTTIVEPICDKECTGAVILSDLFKLNIDDDTARAFQDILEDNSKLKNGESFTKKYI